MYLIVKILFEYALTIDKVCVDYLISLSKLLNIFLNLNKQQRQQKDLSTMECVENFHKSSVYKSKVSIGLC
jgi:hypothetical protein